MLLWPVPLLGLLHAESSAVVAFTAFFVAGLSSIALFSRGERLAPVLLWQVGALAIPLVLLTVTLLWRPNCAYPEGLLFYALFPVPTVLLAVALAFALVRWDILWRRGWLVLIGLGICIAGPIYDVGFHPQFYTYNHIFGGVLGPIYDEELAVRSGLFAFRGLTLLWAGSLMLVGFLRDSLRRTVVAVAATIVVLVIGLAYAFSAEIGLNTTVEVIEEALPGRLSTPHFDIYYDPQVMTAAELKAVADEHEFRYHQLSAALDVEVDGRILSFIYPDPDTKADLTGARYTNVAPVWLRMPQTHVLASEFRRVFPHELAHVFSREFGLPIVNASLAIGLVEGLAVALEPPDGLPTPHEQVSAALLSSTIAADGAAVEGSRDLATVVAAHLSPAGFWTGRGAVSYTTMGSFVRYLLERYGPEQMKSVYATGNFEDVYGKPVERLAEEWAEAVLALPSIEASSGSLVAARFAVPSLFEKRCPHHLPAHRAYYRRAATSLVRGDSLEAMKAVEASLDAQSRYFPSLDLWARLALARGEAESVRARIEPFSRDSMTAALLVRLGDAQALTGDSSAARASYDEALIRLPTFTHEQESMVRLRMAAAGRPDLIRVLVGGPLTATGENDPIAATAQAIALARDENYEQASTLLRTTPGISHGAGLPGAVEIGALERRRMVWLAHFHHLSGAHSVAATYAQRAAEAYRTIGAFNEAAQLDDFRQMMLWLASLSTASSGTARLPVQSVSR